MVQTIFSWICPNVSLLPWETKKHNLKIESFFYVFLLTSKNVIPLIFSYIILNF
jgi:hypothetical protein